MIEAANRCPACTSVWAGRTNEIGGKVVRVCSNCGLWFADPASLMDVDYDDVYDTEYREEHFSSLDATGNWDEFSKYPTYKNFFAEVPRGEAAKLLDVGCGVGRFCRAAYSSGWLVKGIDVSSVALEKGSASVPFPMLNMDLRDMVKLNENFDAVTAFEVLEHLADPDSFLRDVKQVLKKGGHFFCTVPNVQSKSVRTATRGDWIPPIHVLFFSENALRALLQRAGFTDVCIGTIWEHQAPKKLGPGLVKYHLYRFLRLIPDPDPLGLWACCRV